MLVIVGKENNKVRILDTEDATVEVVSTSDVKHYVIDLGMKIIGASIKGIKVVHSDFKDVFRDFFDFMKSYSGYSDKQSNVENGYAAVRDWGSWSMPDDLDEDEEDDFDWEELDAKWYPALKQIANRLKQMYPDLKISITTSEKNWVDLQLERY